MRIMIAKSTSAAAHCAKRRKTTGEYYIPNSVDCSLRASVSEGPVPHSNASKTTARRRGVSAELFSEYTSVNAVRSKVCQQVRSGTNGKNSMSSSTVLAPENDRDPFTPFVQAPMVQKTDLAVPSTKEVSGLSIRATTPGQAKVVQALRRHGLGTPPISTPDNPSVMNVLSPSPVSSYRKAAVISSTTFDGHGRNGSEFPENPPHLSPANGNPMIILTAGVHPSIVASSSSGLSDDSHEAGCIGENPVPRTPAGSNRVAQPDASTITSPADTTFAQSRRGNEGSHGRSTGVQPSSSHMLVPREPKARKTVNSDRRSRKASSNGVGSKQVKDKPKLVTPLEYAQKLQSSLDLCSKLKTNYLKGKHIFYVGGDMMYASTTTRGRMEYVSSFYTLSYFSLHLRPRRWILVIYTAYL